MGQSSVIFGATGLVGKGLVYELLENNNFNKVVVVTRRKLQISNNKLNQLIVNDFSMLEKIRTELLADTFFCCIGTTIGKAGSKEAFRKVDYDIPLTIAHLAESLQIPNLVIISSISANAGSGNFYLRIKGEMEQQVQMIYHGNLKIVRPSIILGHRDDFRPAEKTGQWIITILRVLFVGFLAKYKGIHYWEIARGMIRAVELPRNVIFIESNELHELAVKVVK